MTSEVLHFDEVGLASLDGTWEFFPGDSTLDELDARSPEPIEVPGLWEAQGWLDLDGPAWYRRRFKLESIDGWWSLRFSAVMDRADVWLNGVPIGTHDNGFTPFAVNAGPGLRAGDNVLAVRVVDPS